MRKKAALAWNCPQGTRSDLLFNFLTPFSDDSVATTGDVILWFGAQYFT